MTAEQASACAHCDIASQVDGTQLEADVDDVESGCVAGEVAQLPLGIDGGDAAAGIADLMPPPYGAGAGASRKPCWGGDVLRRLAMTHGMEHQPFLCRAWLWN